MSKSPTIAEIDREIAELEAREKPIRRFSVTIKAGGDTREALVSELRNIVTSIAQGGTGGYTGGPDSGSLHDLLELPEVTGESYMAALKEWLKGSERLDELEQQRADLGLRRSEGPTGNKTIENAAKARECYREALRQVAKRESLTPAELAPVVSNVSGANDYTDGIPARLDHNQP